MIKPHKAMILAAGYGTRLRPLTDGCPKPLVPVWGRPALDILLDQLGAWGVRDVIINLHHRPWDILHHIAETPRRDLRIHFSYEPEILGTGGGLKRVEWFFDDAPFWLINADIVADLNPRPLLKAYDPRRMLAMAWLDGRHGPRTVEMKRGTITNFRHERPGSAHTYTFCGLHLLSRRIFDYLPDDGFAGIVEAYERAMRDGRRIGGRTVEGSLWSDLGTPAEYLEAHKRIRSKHRGKKSLFGGLIRAADRRAREARRDGASLRGVVSLGRNVSMDRRALVRDAIVFDGASVASDATIERAVIGAGVRVHGAVQHMAVQAARSLTARERNRLEGLGWNPDMTTMVVMPPRGSARAYYRLIEGRRRCILMRYDPARSENTLYARHTEFLLACGIPVPRIFERGDPEPFLFMEDAGDKSLQDVPSRALPAAYERVLDIVADWHVNATQVARRTRVPLMDPFGTSLFTSEHELFLGQFGESHVKASSALLRRVRGELKNVSARLSKNRPVLVHRDLQSSNILWHRRRPCFIDFQGMRFGPAAYDLASLVCDPYMELPESLQKRLMADYAARVPPAVFREEDFWPAAVQRLVQALGAYVRLSRTPGCERFLRHIPPARRILRRAIRHTSNLYALDELLVESSARAGQTEG